MAELHVVSGLVAKRSELAGLADHHRKEIERIGGDLRHIDAAIKIFSPDMDLRTIRAKTHQERSVLFRPGEAPRTILDVLRVAGGPLTSREIVERIFAARGIEAAPERIAAVQKSILTAIKGLEAKKLVRVAVVGKGGTRAWEIA